MEKFCASCKRDLPTSSFSKNKNEPDGLQFYCKECCSSKNRAYRKATDQDAVYAKRKPKLQAYYTAIRTLLLAYLQQHGCVDCGEKDPRVLDFDHVGNDKLCNVSALSGSGGSMTRIMNEVSKCEVRCANCHRKKTSIQLGWYSKIDMTTLEDIDITDPFSYVKKKSGRSPR